MDNDPVTHFLVNALEAGAKPTMETYCASCEAPVHRKMAPLCWPCLEYGPGRNPEDESEETQP